MGESKRSFRVRQATEHEAPSFLGIHPFTAMTTLTAQIPGYAFDCHTQKGRKMGNSKAEFFRDEQAALEPFQPGLFDDLIE